MVAPLVPELDPYFSHEGKDTEKVAAGDELARLEHLPAETMIRVAGMTAMVLGAFVFVLFGIPVSGMLRHGDEPGGILLTEQWLWDRWVARMATNLVLAVAGADLGWGLARLRRWSWWVLLALSAAGPVSMVAGVVVKSLRPELDNLDGILGMACILSIMLPASVMTCWAACSSRAVFSPDYQALVARTPQVPAGSGRRKGLGLGLALAMLVQFWTLLFLILGVLVICGVIRTV